MYQGQTLKQAQNCVQNVHNPIPTFKKNRQTK